VGRVLGRALPNLGLLLERHRTGVTVSRPGAEDVQQPGVGAGDDGPPLARLELEEVAGGSGLRAAVGSGDLDLAIGDDESSALVYLVLLQLLAGGQAEQHRAGVLAGGEDLGPVRLDVNST